MDLVDQAHIDILESLRKAVDEFQVDLPSNTTSMENLQKVVGRPPPGLSHGTSFFTEEDVSDTLSVRNSTDLTNLNHSIWRDSQPTGGNSQQNWKDRFQSLAKNLKENTDAASASGCAPSPGGMSHASSARSNFTASKNHDLNAQATPWQPGMPAPAPPPGQPGHQNFILIQKVRFLRAGPRHTP
jgi:hypothetical protein